MLAIILSVIGIIIGIVVLILVLVYHSKENPEVFYSDKFEVGGPWAQNRLWTVNIVKKGNVVVWDIYGDVGPCTTASKIWSLTNIPNQFKYRTKVPHAGWNAPARTFDEKGAGNTWGVVATTDAGFVITSTQAGDLFTVGGMAGIPQNVTFSYIINTDYPMQTK